jgi:hypothetical protein
MHEELEGRIVFFRSHGHWQMRIEAPSWVISDVVSEVRVRGLHWLNSAGTLDSEHWSMLIGTSAKGSDPGKSEDR